MIGAWIAGRGRRGIPARPCRRSAPCSCARSARAAPAVRLPPRTASSAASSATTTWVGGVKRHCVVFSMYAHWSCRSSASECVARALLEQAAPHEHEAHAGAPSRHLPEAAISASKGVLRASMASAPNELIASTIRPGHASRRPRDLLQRIRTPVDVSQWISADMRDRRIGRSAARRPRRSCGRPRRSRTSSGRAAHHLESLAMRWP